MRTFLLALLLAGCGCVSVPSHESVRATTHRIDMEVAEGVMVCSATAIAPDQLLTATHCLVGMRSLRVDTKPAVVKAVSTYEDAAIVTLSGPLFATWAERGPAPKQGDRVRWWGNPRSITNVYREGVVAKVEETVVAIDGLVCHGDSGAGIFNAYGQVIAVMSRMAPDVAPCTFGVAQL